MKKVNLWFPMIPDKWALVQAGPSCRAVAAAGRLSAHALICELHFNQT